MIIFFIAVILILLFKIFCEENLIELRNRCKKTNTVTPAISVQLPQANISIVIVQPLPELITHNGKITEETKCVICQCYLHQSDDYCKLNCGHLYHNKCIHKWKKERNECPLCRKQIY